MAKSRTGRGKHSKGGAPRHGKTTRSKDRRLARLITRKNAGRHARRRLKNKIKKITSNNDDK